MHCQNDTSCPGPYVCMYGMKTWNATGSAIPGVLPEGCWCSPWYGNIGDNCTSYNTPVATWWITVTSLDAIAAYSLAIFTFWDAIRLFRAMPKFVIDAQIVCFIQLIVAFILLGIGETVFAIQPATPLQYTIVAGEKASAYDLMGYVLIIVGITAGFLACISVALLWLEVGLSSKRLKQTHVRAVSRSRIAMIIFECTFVTTMIVTLFVLSATFLAFVAIFFEICCLVTYIIGFIVLSNVLNQSARPAMASPRAAGAAVAAEDVPSTGTSKFDEILRDMRRTLLLIVLFQMLTLGCSLTAGTLTLISWREAGGPPDGPVPPVLGAARVTPTMVICLAAVVLSFTHQSANRRVKRLKGIATSQDPSSTGGGNQGNKNTKSVTDNSSNANALAVAAPGGGGGGGERDSHRS